MNVRPRVIAPQPGMPAVKAAVDRNRVPLGDLVTFTLTPASVVLNPHYTVTIFFGDKKSERIRRQTQIDHLYTTTGTFTYSILVEAVEPLVTVRLSATPTSVDTNSLVNFKAELSQSYPKMKYRFVFADGSQTDWQDSPLTTHSYRSAKTYPAYVDIGLGSSGSVKQMGGSPRRAIEVRSPRPPPIAVELTANRVTVQAKDEVRFQARLNSPVDSNGPNVRYRFSFGDRSGSTEWQASPQTAHVYPSAGAYPAIVEVRVVNSRFGQQNASSKRLSIKVERAPLPSVLGVDLWVTPRFVPAGFPVYFKARSDSANANTRYRFNFGDGSPPGAWKETPEETHIYALAGTYPAFVEIGWSGSAPNAAGSSAPKQVRVTPGIPAPSASPAPSPAPSASPSDSPGTSPTVIETTSSSPSPGPTPSPSVSPSPSPTPAGGQLDDWWKYLLLALILFGGYQGWKYFFAPSTTLEPHIDPGVAALGTEGGPLSINLQMELDPNVTDGQFAVDTTEASLIKSERKGDG